MEKEIIERLENLIKENKACLSQVKQIDGDIAPKQMIIDCNEAVIKELASIKEDVQGLIKGNKKALK